MNNSSELKNRVLTGVIGGAALLCIIIFGGHLGVFFLVTALSLGMLFEFTGIAFTLADKVEKRYVLLSLTWLMSLINLLISQNEFPLIIFSFLGLFTYFLLTAKRHDESLFLIHFKELAYSVFGVVYLVFIPSYFQKIYDLPNGLQWILLFLFIVWSGDSGAYFAGKKYGKNKLYPLISPKKSWQGAAGGLLSGWLITLLFKLLFFRTMPWLGVFTVPFLVGIVAQVGDLCESFFKRSFDVKDSGAILPGHGGFLDRFDGVVFSLPVMYACIRIFG